MGTVTLTIGCELVPVGTNFENSDAGLVGRRMLKMLLDMKSPSVDGKIVCLVREGVLSLL